MGRIYEYDIITTNGQGSFSKIFRLPKEWKYVNAIAILKFADDPTASPTVGITIQQGKKVILDNIPEYFLWLEEGYKSLPYWLPFRANANGETLELFFNTNGLGLTENEKWRVWLYCSNELTKDDLYFKHQALQLVTPDNCFKRYKIELPNTYDLLALGLKKNTEYEADLSIINNSKVFLKNVNPYVLAYSGKVEFFKRLFAYELKSNEFDVEMRCSSDFFPGNTVTYNLLIVAKRVKYDSIRTK